ncbi:TetR family transcriptional regulator [Mycobacteroides abscessus subsp. massiliense]|nr:TetR family transcriptional regulator [Mycobacteroides abscessus subsp. massiliense]SKH92582.1 TetR family transcriptional regulator [Mycobacteroides abscessus subsp. massiliense]SKI13338.1 TetR family transcriptional regulator [Mycobacteroides abscessus subsp. massiliense]SKK30090.1 TetR family transcriptional regulator [Mycobacteroides abscessus subsp. massiliense]SKK36491.1 TetR family transcriptional regulator [Mycobacteroides abscessus subsp. massiliense]
MSPTTSSVRTYISEVQRQILVAAERLFAEHGVVHVSLRSIGVEAGQKNNSVVQYHFATKAALIRALYDFRMIPLNCRRLEQLDALTDPSVHELVDAFIRPLGTAVVEAAGANSYARFLHRYLDEAKGEFELFEGRHTRGVTIIYGLLNTRLGHLAGAAQTERIHQMNTIVTAVLADIENRLGEHRIDRTQAAVAVDSLVSGTTAFLQAP